MSATLGYENESYIFNDKPQGRIEYSESSGQDTVYAPETSGLVVGGLVSILGVAIAFAVNQPILAVLFIAPVLGAFMGLAYLSRYKEKVRSDNQMR